jgi:hypothetical protein
MEPIIDELVLGWLDLLRKRFARPDQGLCDIGKRIQFLTVDIITKICLGDEIGCIKNDCDMHRLLETVEMGNKVCQYFSVFLEMNTLFFQLARIPALAKRLFPRPCDSTGVGRIMGVSLLYVKLQAKVDRATTDDSPGSGSAHPRREQEE